MEQEVEKREQKKILFSYESVKMRFALCDASRTLLKQIKYLIYKYAENKRLDIVVDCYRYGEEVLNSKEKYNIIFLGYGLMGANGLEIAKQLRKSNGFSAIIFISDCTDFILESFAVSPYRFLLSPPDEDKVFKALDEFFNDYGKNYPLWIKSGEDINCLNAQEVIYLEADGKYCRVHLKDEILHTNRTMARVYSVLPRSSFIKINRAFIVNCNFITKYNNEYVFLKNGEKLHISRNYLKSFKDEYKAILNPRLP